MFSESRREAIVRFVDIGRIVDNHCFKLSFLNNAHVHNGKIMINPYKDKNRLSIPFFYMYI